MQNSNWRQYVALVTLSLIALASAGAGLMNFLSSSDPTDSTDIEISRIVNGVDSIELVVRDLQRGYPLFSVVYAINSGYKHILYRNNIYAATGFGGATILPNPGSRPTYIIEERIIEQNHAAQTQVSEFHIKNRGQFEIIASGTVRRGRVNQAITFIKSVIQPSARDTKKAAIAYGTATSIVGTYNTRPSLLNCPGTFRIEHGYPFGLSRQILVTEHWAYGARLDVKDVAYTSGYILVFSGIFHDMLYVDILDQHGAFLGITELKSPVSTDAKLFRVANAKLVDGRFVVRLDHARLSNTPKKEWVLHEQSEVKVPVPLDGNGSDDSA